MTQRDPRQTFTADRQPRWVSFSLGPSCLLSLVIVLLLVVLIQRFVPLGVVGVGVLALVAWFGVSSALMRRRMATRREAPEPAEDRRADELPANVVEAEWWDPEERQR